MEPTFIALSKQMPMVKHNSPFKFTICWAVLCLLLKAPLLSANNLPIDLGGDTTLCSGHLLTLSSPIISDTLDYLWSTGDTTATISVAESNTYGLTVTSANCVGTDNIEVLFLPSPMVDLEANSTCFGEQVLINSNATYEGMASFNWDFGDGTSTDIVSNQISHLFPGNGSEYEVILTIDNPNGCSAADTLMVNSLLKPTAQFQTTPACFNEATTIIDLSDDLTSSAFVEIDYGDGNIATEPSSASFSIVYNNSGTYSMTVIVDNDNGCRDTTVLTNEVYSLPTASFVGLDVIYCAGDPTDTLTGFPSGGIFSGPNISNTPNLDDAIGFFNPQTAGTELSITYAYTDENGCTGTSTNLVDEVFPKLPLSFVGEEPLYCLGDSNQILCVNFPDGTFSGPSLSFDPALGSDKAIFSPDEIGEYEIQYDLIDENGCFNTTSLDITVAGIVGLNLPSDTFVVSGQTLVLGMDPSNPDYSYLWSNGSTSALLNIVNPGFYLLNVTDEISGCSKSDTTFVDLAIPVGLASNFSQIKIKSFPNPVVDKLHISITPGYTGETFLEIIDPLGKVSLREELFFTARSTHTQVLDLSILPGGIYYLKIDTHIAAFIKQ